MSFSYGIKLWSVGEVVNTIASQAIIHEFEPRTDYQIEITPVIFRFLLYIINCWTRIFVADLGRNYQKNHK